MLGLHPHRVRLHPEVAVEVIVNVAQSPDEAESQERLGHAIIPSESGDDDDDGRWLRSSANRKRLQHRKQKKAEEASTGQDEGEDAGDDSERAS